MTLNARFIYLIKIQDLFIVLKYNILCVHVCMCVWCVYMCGSKKRTSEPLERELNVGVGYLMWVLGTALCSSVLLTAEPSYPILSTLSIYPVSIHVIIAVTTVEKLRTMKNSCSIDVSKNCP